ELAARLRLPDLLLDPGLPANAGRLACRHGASVDAVVRSSVRTTRSPSGCATPARSRSCEPVGDAQVRPGLMPVAEAVEEQAGREAFDEGPLPNGGAVDARAIGDVLAAAPRQS